jgi:hypothetical protein
MHKSVEVLIGRLATDSELRTRFAKEPWEALRTQRLELTEVEFAALAAVDPEALQAFALALDARLRRAERVTTEPLPSTHRSKEETTR